MSPDPIVKIENLNVIYNVGRSNEMQALYNVNLEIFPGEFIVLFGPSGCGKSTLMYSIAGLQPNTSGDVFVNNKNITALKPKEVEFYHQKKTGMIFQAYYLIPSVSVLQNVMLPQIAIGGNRKIRAEKAKELLKHFGVLEQAHKLPLELSGGQQQRVAICRSLVNDPEILLADEPVGNLDSKSSHGVMELLQDLNKKQNKTIVLVTHDLSFLGYAHRVVYIRDGKIIDIKTNSSVSQIIPSDISQKVSASAVSKELELLSRTYSSLLDNQVSGLLVPFKARQIVYDILTGMALEEIEKIEKFIEKLIVSGVRNDESPLEFLDSEKEKGGAGLDRRVASYIFGEVNSILREVEFISQREGGYKIPQIRNYLLDCVEHKIEDEDAVKILDQAIENRMKNEIGKVAFEKILDLPVKKKGAGLDKRIVKRIAQRMELLMLCAYR